MGESKISRREVIRAADSTAEMLVEIRNSMVETRSALWEAIRKSDEAIRIGKDNAALIVAFKEDLDGRLDPMEGHVAALVRPSTFFQRIGWLLTGRA